MAKPKGTWFGAWRYNSDDNKIEGIGDFNNDGKDDILISSPWGIGILKLAGNTLTSIDAIAYNHLLGNWYFTKKDLICGIGNFNGQGEVEILLKKLN